MLTDFEQPIVSFFQDAADVLGAPRSVAAVYGILFASPQPLCFGEIEVKLGISKGSVSQGLKALKEIGAVKSSEHPGDRREWYEVDIELRKLIRSFIEGRVETQLRKGGDRLERIKSQLPNTDPAAARILTDRLELLESWQKKAKALIPIVKAFLALGG